MTDELTDEQLENVIGGAGLTEWDVWRSKFMNENKIRKMEANKPVEQVPDCQYCDNKEPMDLTTCEKCNCTFCIYCVGYSGVGFETYDVCPGCGDIFTW